MTGYIGAVKVGGWSVVIEPEGWKIAVDSEIRARISQGIEVVSACCHEYASDTSTYEIDGKTITWFDPMNPSSSRAAILTAWSRRYATSGWILTALSKAQTSIPNPQLLLPGEQDHRLPFSPGHAEPAIARRGIQRGVSRSHPGWTRHVSVGYGLYSRPLSSRYASRSSPASGMRRASMAPITSRALQ